ncbi:MAG: hypothetical protein QXS32_01965 [Candidatus Nezhaarchaeales archaeon]
MSQLSEYLKRIVVVSLNVSGMLGFLKDLANKGVLDSLKLYDLLKKAGFHSHPYGIIDMLLRYGILRRRRVHEFEVVNKEKVLEIINSLEEFFSDKVVVPDGYQGLHGRTFFFIRSGMKIFRLRKLAVDSIVERLAEYLIVPRDSLKELVLAVNVEKNSISRETYVRLYWIDPEALSSPGDIIKGVFPKEKSCRAKVGELLNYTFDVDEGDLIEVDLNEIPSAFINEVKVLADKVFHIKGEVGHHDEICSTLAEIGRVKGYEVSLEHKIIGELRLDVAYIKDGAIAAAFEVVLMGNLKEALFKLSLVNARVKFLVVERNKISKAKEILPKDVRLIEAETVAEAKRSIAALVALLDEIGKALNEQSTEVH